MFIKILCFRLNFYVFYKCVNKTLQKDDSSREGRLFPDVIGRPLQTVSNADLVSINFLCHR